MGILLTIVMMSDPVTGYFHFSKVDDDGVLVRYPDKSIAWSMAEKVAATLGRELQNVWPQARRAPDGAAEWFFRFKPPN
jgi:hypothetical protein